MENKTDTVDSAPTVKKKHDARIGHNGYHRPIPDHVDEEKSVHVAQCPDCYSGLSSSVTIRTRIIEDISIIRPHVTRYSIERRYCRKCKRIVEPMIKEALPNASISLRTMFTISYMKTVKRFPAARVCQIMMDLINLHVARCEVIHIVHLISRHLGTEYRNLIGKVRKARARYIDETSWRIHDMNSYMWSEQDPLNILKDHDGINMHDGFSAYYTLARKTKNKQACCWARILNDAK